MTLNYFRINHSTIIEHYQFIEHHLEGIYTKICGKPFLNGLQMVEKSNIHQLVLEIKQVEAEKNISILSALEYEQLEHIRVRRNYWCHNCYVEMVFDRKSGTPRETYVNSLIEDIRDAEALRNRLYQIFMEL